MACVPVEIRPEHLPNTSPKSVTAMLVRSIQYLCIGPNCERYWLRYLACILFSFLPVYEEYCNGESYEVTQFRVTIATNCRALILSRNFM
jgi:hypothetical protein